MAEIDALSLAKREGHMVLIKMELIVAQKLVAANKHHLRHIDKSSLTNTINIR
jgi:hypothetical protein